MKRIITLTLTTAFISIGSQLSAQMVIDNDTDYNTKSQMLLANEMFKSGEPFAEALGYNLDLLDPMILNQTDSISYTFGIENYESSRYLLNTLTGRSGLGLHMMWSPIITMNAAMQPSSFDGMFTGGTPNGYKEDDMLKMMIGNFGMNANQTPPANAFPQFADFAQGSTNLPQTVAADFATDFATTRWDRSLMDKTLNLGAMGQSSWKQYFWAQDMLGAFHDGLDNGIDADGTNSPDSLNSPNFDPNNDIFYGGNNLDGYIGQVLTAAYVNKTNFLINNMAYDGTSLGMVNPATYDPANGIQYFPTKIGVTETMVITGLPPKMSALTVVDATSNLFDQASYLLATTSFKNMMDPTNTDPDHYAYKEVFDGYPFPSAMGVNGATAPGPYDLMKGTSKVIFLNMMAMHYNSTMGTFVDESSLNSSGVAVPGLVVSAENVSYTIQALAQMSAEFSGTPLQTMADNALIAQVNFILTNMKDANGGFYNSFTIGTGASSSTQTLAANSAIITGLYAAYQSTNDASYLTEANAAYNYMINTFYNASEMVFKTEKGNNTAVYTPWNMALLSGSLREASLVGTQPEAAAIYTRVFKTVFNKMLIAEAEATGETGNDSDGDGIPYIAGGTKPFVFAEQGTYTLTTSSVASIDANSFNVSVFPNPASNNVNVSVDLKQDANIIIGIYDLNGRLVVELNENQLSNGTQTVSIPVAQINAGVYVIRTAVNNEPVSIDHLVID